MKTVLHFTFTFCLILCLGNTGFSQKVIPKVTVSFKSESAKLTSETKKELKALIATLSTTTYKKVSIYGHGHKTGGSKKNVDLADDRKMAVYNYLKDNGIPDQKLRTFLRKKIHIIHHNGKRVDKNKRSRYVEIKVS